MRYVESFKELQRVFLLFILSICGFESFSQPNPPTDLYVISLDSENELFWTASSTTGVTYNIYRSLDLVNFTQISTGEAVTSYLDKDLTNDEFYFYQVTAYDGIDESDITAPSANTDASTPLEKLGNSIQFDGIDDYLQVNDANQIQFNYIDNVSVEFWVRFKTVRESHILDRMLSDNNTHYYEVFLNTDSQFEVGATFLSGLTSTTVVEAGEWYHVAFTFDYSTKVVTLYVNGIEESSTPLSGFFFSSEQSTAGDKYLTIGAQTEYSGGVVNYSNFFDGQLAELRLWNKTLLSTEIADNKDVYLRGDESNLIGLWHLNDLFDDVVYCYTPVNTDAVGYGGPTQFSVNVEAINDNIAALEDQSTHLDIRDNDEVSFNESVITEIVDGPDNGSATIINRDSILYIPNADYVGSDAIEYLITDTTAIGGRYDNAKTAFVYITVNPVNDAPSFTKGTDAEVNEDSGSQLLSGWATSINTGSTNESTQALSFTVTNNNNALFSVQPSIDALGNLSYTPTADAHGSAIVEVGLSDDGGTTNGGTNQSNIETFNITVNSINDAPSFTMGSNIVIDEDEGSVTLPFWASDINPGPSNESSQTLSFSVSNDNNDLFLDQPAIDVSGNLTFTSRSDANGSTNVSVTLEDSGGGDNVSATAPFLITLTPVNDAPTDISISSTTLGENEPVGSYIGTLNTVDADGGESYTYSLSGTDESYFELIDDVLVSNESFDYEVHEFYDISIRTTDASGLIFDKDYSIIITNVNEAPNITTQEGNDVAVFNIDENTNLISTVSAEDVDLNTNLTYDIIGGEDQSLFDIVAETGSVEFINSQNYEVPQDVDNDNVYNLIVSVSDGALNDEQMWVINVEEVNEPPTDISLSNVTINENGEIGNTIGVLSTTDEDSEESHSYSIIDGPFSDDFSINDEVLSTNVSWDFEELDDIEITIRSLDSRGAYYDQLFELNISDVNEAPTDILLSNNTVFENEPEGTLVGELSTLDEDLDENHNYSIIDLDGDVPFYIEDDRLYTETMLYVINNTIYNITIQSEDKGGQTVQRDLQILIEQNTELGLTIPTAFSPNGDNENDFWEILNLDLAERCGVRVFDRYGKTVFESDSYENRWDGSYRGSKLPKGTYYYDLVELRDGRNNRYKGFVVIL